jgi:hypothetical protein
LRRISGAADKRYENWKDIARVPGPPWLRAIEEFRDEALAGEWKGDRSSRLVFPGWEVALEHAA